MRSISTLAPRRLLATAVLSLAAAGTLRADEVIDWHDHMLTALVKAGTSPVLSTREAAMVSAAVFDAVNGVERRYTPIHVSETAPRGASKRAAAVEAAYTVLASRFPAQAAELAAKRTASLAAIEDGQSKIRGLAWGQAVAGAILTWRSTDGISPAPPPYLGGTAAGQWRPTGPAFLPGATPQFATMTPWLIQSPSQFLPPPPNALDSQAYADDLLEVRLMGSVGSPLRTADETDACRFWAAVSGTYAWNATAMDFAVANGYELSDNALLLARLNLAVADSIIGCWNAKYTYSYWRPDTAIEFDPFEPDAGWAPLIVTPNHPEYISGHSSVTGAALAVLIDAFGDDAPFAVESPVTPGWIRSFSSFSDAMSEVADARIFGGIHFRKACVEGANIGGNTVSFILANRMQRLHGEGE